MPTVTGQRVIGGPAAGGGTVAWVGTIATDTLANKFIGGGDLQQVAYRFKAEQTSTLTSVRWMFIGTSASSYSGGTGGTIRLEIQSDSSGVPSGTVLATCDADLSGSVLAVNDGYPLTTFSTPASLTAGTIYHVVLRNVHASQGTNYISADNLFVYGAHVTPRQPRWADTDFGMLLKTYYSPWTIEGGTTPIVDIGYGNGAHQGMGWVGVSPLVPATISGTNYMARQRFTMAASKTVSGGGVRVSKNSGSGSLTVRLEDTSGTLIDSFTASTSSVPTQSGTYDGGAGIWLTGTFSTPRTLAAGSTYNLRLSTDASTSLWTRGMERGNLRGFTAGTYFAESMGLGLQTTTNGGTNWSTTNGGRGDMQFYLT